MSYATEVTFKRIGNLLAQALEHLESGMDAADRISNAKDEKERELLEAVLAQSVHHSWASLMRAFRRLGHDMDKGIPKGQQASLRLLAQMETRTNERPSVISMRYSHTLRKILDFHSAFRRGDPRRHSAGALIEYLSVIQDEVAPDIISSVQVMAIANPGGRDLLKHLPNTDQAAPVTGRIVA